MLYLNKANSCEETTLVRKLDSLAIDSIEKILNMDKTVIVKPTKDKVLIQSQMVKTEYSQSQASGCKDKSVE